MQVSKVDTICLYNLIAFVHKVFGEMLSRMLAFAKKQ